MSGGGEPQPNNHGLTLPVPIKRGAPPAEWKGEPVEEQMYDQQDDGMQWFMEPPYGAGLEVPPGYEPGILYTARCFCRRVEFHVTEAPTAAKICDCTACQQLHGAPLQWAALFPKTSVHFTPRSREFLHFYNIGLDRVYTDGAIRDLPCKVRCSHCGTWVADEGRNMFMAFPTLFDFPDGECPDVFRPQCRIFCTAQQVLEKPGNKYGLPCFIDDRRTPATPGDLLRYIVPSLDGSRHKGQCGRVGIIGGSQDFTGAPYYAGMAALRTGADLVYVFTAKEAATAIKAYALICFKHFLFFYFFFHRFRTFSHACCIHFNQHFVKNANLRYSPELMVMPVYERRRMLTPETSEEEIENFVRLK